MTINKKNLFIISLLLLINPLFAQISDETIKINPMLELFGANAKTLALKGNVTQMRVQQFLTDAKGNKIIDSLTFSNLYKFDKDGLTKEFEQNYKNLQSKTHFYSYNNKGYISHIDIETLDLAKKNDSLNTASDSTAVNESSSPVYSTVDYKYVQKKNILYKGEDFTEKPAKKTSTRNEYFYHLNDDSQIEQIDYQSADIMTKYFYESNALVKEVHTFKSGILTCKNIYKYDRNNRLTNIAVINSDNTVKYPNKETIITYKLDEKGNITEKKMTTYLYSSKGNKEFLEGFLNLYNYTY